MNINIPRDMDTAGQVTGIMFIRRSQFLADRGDIAQIPNLRRGADGDAFSIGGHTHRAIEHTEMGINLVFLSPQQH